MINDLHMYCGMHGTRTGIATSYISMHREPNLPQETHQKRRVHTNIFLFISIVVASETMVGLPVHTGLFICWYIQEDLNDSFLFQSSIKEILRLMKLRLQFVIMGVSDSSLQEKITCLKSFTV